MQDRLKFALAGAALLAGAAVVASLALAPAEPEPAIAAPEGPLADLLCPLVDAAVDAEGRLAISERWIAAAGARPAPALGGPNRHVGVYPEPSVEERVALAMASVMVAPAESDARFGFFLAAVAETRQSARALARTFEGCLRAAATPAPDLLLETAPNDDMATLRFSMARALTEDETGAAECRILIARESMGDIDAIWRAIRAAAPERMWAEAGPERWSAAYSIEFFCAPD